MKKAIQSVVLPCARGHAKIPSLFTPVQAKLAADGYSALCMACQRDDRKKADRYRTKARKGVRGSAWSLGGNNRLFLPNTSF